MYLYLIGSCKVHMPPRWYKRGMQKKWEISSTDLIQHGSCI